MSLSPPKSNPYTIHHIPHTSNKHLHLVSLLAFQTWTSCARTWRDRWVWHRASSQRLGHHCLEVQLFSTLAFSTVKVSYFLMLYILPLILLLSIPIPYPSIIPLLSRPILFPSFTPLLSLSVHFPHSSSLSFYTLLLSLFDLQARDRGLLLAVH
jgi:hypothetical protein